MLTRPGQGTWMSRTPLRAQTIAPNNRRQVPSKSPRAQQYPQTHLSPPFGASRSSSMPARGVAQPPSPVSAKPGTSPRQTIPIRTPSPKTKAAPISPKVSSPHQSEHTQQEKPAPPKIDATPEQHNTVRKIQEVYRAHAAHAQALRTITDLRARFDRPSAPTSASRLRSTLSCPAAGTA